MATGTLLLVLLLASNARAQVPAGESSSQPPSTGADRQNQPPRWAELALPFGSLAIPGLGQWVQHAPTHGLVYGGLFLSGFISSRAVLNSRRASIDDLDTLDSRTELGVWLRQASQEAGAVSAYDSFHRSLPFLQRAGKYQFLTESDTPAALMRAPTELHFLKEKTTYIPIAIVVALAIADRTSGPDKGREFVPLSGRDVAFSMGVAYNAGVGEEALYRGYLLPLFQQRVGGRVWLANGLQAAIFAGAHGNFSPAALSAHFGFGYYSGYLVNRNHGGLRQTVFNHFMWDAIAISTSFLTRQRDRIDPRALPMVTIVF